MLKLVHAFDSCSSGIRLLQDIARPSTKFGPWLETFKPVLIPPKVSSRLFSLTPASFVKTITETQDGDKLVIEGVISASTRENSFVKSDHECKACPLCRLNLDVKHTDVLILSQFVRSDGCLLPKRVTGLCTLQQKRVSYMVTMAHKAGLMGRFKPQNCDGDPRKRKEWKKWNTYFDEKTIKPPKSFLALRYQEKQNAYLKSREEIPKQLD